MLDNSCYTVDMSTHHRTKVQKLAQQIQQFYTAKKPFKIYHGSTNSTRILSFKRDEMIDTSHFNDIIHIDTAKKTVRVEANVPMDKLVKATLKHGLVPPVIPEFPGITVGGAIQGGAGESSSFKWGFLSQTTNWVEYVLGNGDVRRVSDTDHPDLFYGAAGSCGTMGVITAAEIQLLPAKKYVAASYVLVAGFADCVEKMQAACRSGEYDFVDAIMFEKHGGLLVCGKLSDEQIGAVQRFSRARDPWFYLHAEQLYKQGTTVTESVPLVDYLFRYNRGAFWVGRFAFEIFHVPFNRFRRFILNPILNTRKLYQALQVSGASQQYIVQDLTMPVEHAVDVLRYIDKKLGIYPLWVCPVKPAPASPLLCNSVASDLAINIGVWGPRIEQYDEFVAINKDIGKRLCSIVVKSGSTRTRTIPKKSFGVCMTKNGTMRCVKNILQILCRRYTKKWLLPSSIRSMNGAVCLKQFLGLRD